MSFLQELKRRNVFRVGVAYVLLAWLLLQGADFALDLIGAPNWVIQALSIVVVTGLPIALVIAWAFELTPEGVRRAEDVDPSAERRRPWGVLQYAVLTAAVAGISWLLYQVHPAAEPQSEPSLPTDVSQQVEPLSAQSDRPSKAGASIAVLPFVNMSDDEAQEYFSDGISEELLNVLSRVSGLRVASRTSSFAFKGENRNIREIASILNVDHILEGSVRKAGNQVRITAQLIDAGTDKHLWSNSYDRELNDIFAIQDEISGAIVHALQDIMDVGGNLSVEVTAATTNMDAYDLYLQAASLLNVMSVENMKRRTRLLEQVVELDPEFHRAWAELAGVYAGLPSWDHSLDTQEYIVLAQKAAEQALALSPDDAEANLVLARVFYSRADWSSWREQLARAQALYEEQEPGNPNPHAIACFQWLGLGYLSRALEVATEGLALQPDNNFMHLIAAMSLLDLGRREEARGHFDQAILFGYAGGASDQVWEYVDPTYERTAWIGTTAMYFLDHDPELLSLMPHFVRVRFAAPADREVEIRRFWRTANELGFTREELLSPSDRWGYRLSTDMMASLGEFETIANQYWGNSPKFWMWAPALRSFRQSNAFRERARSTGMPTFWREYEWPDLCRAVDDVDFACD